MNTRRLFEDLEFLQSTSFDLLCLIRSGYARNEGLVDAESRQRLSALDGAFERLSRQIDDIKSDRDLSYFAFERDNDRRELECARLELVFLRSMAAERRGRSW